MGFLKLVSLKESLILNLLREKGEMFGLQMVKSSKRKLKRGTVYVTLSRMKEKGLIKVRSDEALRPGLPLRMYSLTALGRRELALKKKVDELIKQERGVKP